MAKEFYATGMDDVVKNVEVIIGEKVEAAGIELERQAKRTQTLAKRYVPVDTGALKESIRTDQVVPVKGRPRPGRDRATGRFRGGPLGFRVTAGGPNVNPKSGKPTTEYAAKVHETHRSKSKFLERAAQKVAANMTREIAAKMQRAGGRIRR